MDGILSFVYKLKLIGRQLLDGTTRIKDIN